MRSYSGRIFIVVLPRFEMGEFGFLTLGTGLLTYLGSKAYY
jgi:hypothetical protein